MAKVSLAGIHYPDTTSFFGDVGIIDVTGHLVQRGWSVEGRQLYMADHYRATADMIVRWALSDSGGCNVEVAEWFPSPEDKQMLLKLLDVGKPMLLELDDSERWKPGLARSNVNTVCRCLPRFRTSHPSACHSRPTVLRGNPNWRLASTCESPAFFNSCTALSFSAAAAD